jgi:hypothetical protein
VKEVLSDVKPFLISAVHLPNVCFFFHMLLNTAKRPNQEYRSATCVSRKTTKKQSTKEEAKYQEEARN